MPAAEAAQCAHAQGKFWEYHDRIFVNQPVLGRESYRRFAAEVGLDMDAFNACVESGEMRDGVRQEYEKATELGISATPSFFINGRFVTGAMPLEVFQQIIDEELED